MRRLQKPSVKFNLWKPLLFPQTPVPPTSLLADTLLTEKQTFCRDAVRLIPISYTCLRPWFRIASLSLRTFKGHGRQAKMLSGGIHLV